MNKELLLKVKAAILAEPEKFDMSDWSKQIRHSCGTAACLGGWANVIYAGFTDPDQAIKAYGPNSLIGSGPLCLSEDQNDILCYSPFWPLVFNRRYRDGQIMADSTDAQLRRNGHQMMAEAAAGMIDFFISVDGDVDQIHDSSGVATWNE